jgi:ankyrin repeat protein
MEAVSIAKHEADVSWESNSMSAGLFEAIDQQDVNRVAALLSQGADPNTLLVESPHWRPLAAALEEVGWYDGPMEIVRLLLQAGADPNGWDGEHNSTPLHLAMRLNNKEAIQLLLEAGADPNLVSAEGESALSWAVEQGDVEMAKLLLRHGAGKTINAFGPPCGYTPLDFAARKLSLPLIELLLEAGADPEAPDEDGYTARDRLPPRDKSDPEVWDAALELLALRTA